MKATEAVRLREAEKRIDELEATIKALKAEVFGDEEVRFDKEGTAQLPTLRGVVNLLCARGGFSGVPKQCEGYIKQMPQPRLPGVQEIDETVGVG